MWEDRKAGLAGQILGAKSSDPYSQRGVGWRDILGQEQSMQRSQESWQQAE